MSTGDPINVDRDSEGMMLPGTTDQLLGEQLLRIARNPDLRQVIYERLREYCHQCRNRLNSLKLSLYLAMKQSPSPGPEPWLDVDRQYQDLERRVERVQALCRPLTLSRVTLGLDLLIDDRRETWTRIMSSKGRGLDFVPPAERAVASFDVERLVQVLDLLVAWRSAEPAAAGPAKLRWWVESGYAHIAWEEATSSPPTVGPQAEDGATWTLPLIARVALAHGGDLQVAADRGWRLEVSWPSQPVTP